ncbi:restriction endonuclease subunit S [Flavobacterium rhamnosiphilum]|uniref:Restriction endonuclease subunit S n=1 Tax=Flavobacterium rhamnosiphilum TaxID=2541724 RepID=A0A4R5F6V6_9FLAO|nr:restriction endonuclease subunit S [Flavobacterium rhamnosiphilum]TDE43190.1 restriction endonuclease subunit S [Flavobacterium rhamnosiphilum]
MTNETVVPQLRFPEYNNEWCTKSISEVLKIGSGSDYKHLSQGNVPVFGTGGIMTYVNDFLYDGETVCIGRKGTIDKPVYFNGKIWTVDTLFYTHSFNGLIPKFAYCLFQKINWKRYSEASGVPSLSKNTIEKIEIVLPSLPEQEKIASFLFSIDKQIHLLEKEKALLEKFKKGVFQKIFNQEIRFKDDNGNDFPAWEEKKLGDIGVNYNGLTGKSKEDFGSGKPYVQYKQIFDQSKIDVLKFQYVNVLENENQNTVEYGDILFTTSSETPNEIGTSSVMLDKIEDLYLNSFGFRPNSLEVLVPEFSRFYFQSHKIRTEIIKLAQGSIRYNLSKTEFLKLSISLPSKDEQSKIGKYLSQIETTIDKKVIEIENTYLFKKSLLQKMFV